VQARGVLSVWSHTCEQLFDYELYACGEALMVDRDAHDCALIVVAQSSGAAIVSSGRSATVDRQEKGCRLTFGGVEIRAAFLVDASGGAVVSPGRRRRHVGFTTAS
jgi:flavin-dependent dehydrogenase